MYNQGFHKIAENFSRFDSFLEITQSEWISRYTKSLEFSVISLRISVIDFWFWSNWSQAFRDHSGAVLVSVSLWGSLVLVLQKWSCLYTVCQKTSTFLIFLNNSVKKITEFSDFWYVESYPKKI